LYLFRDLEDKLDKFCVFS